MSEIVLVYDCNVILTAVKYSKAWKVKSQITLCSALYFSFDEIGLNLIWLKF